MNDYTITNNRMDGISLNPIKTSERVGHNTITEVTCAGAMLGLTNYEMLTGLIHWKGTLKCYLNPNSVQKHTSI